ncbi:cell division protein FtsB [Oceanospirillaceae bacterium]|jgi:cell division protein FtsB|nr:cell division protein FtsB [Oceanospirillaceae bacterium]MBT4997812.1 cell division protein FtsB [Oceanospirillaceae bacterium]MBT5629676.1 cell division protein FtsB [Oceanospirillaceae bacterium]MBT6101132.1 cell division protein FtsB [Oceanospirillaceae bacterium]MBT7673547.1 cell division protein FtsB [Oceanospirillaceae bacterium]
MKWLVGLIFVTLLAMQYSLWWGQSGLLEVERLQDKITAQEAVNTSLSERNQQLHAEVLDLKQGIDAIEERARHDLGMVKPNETFYQLVEDQ